MELTSKTIYFKSKETESEYKELEFAFNYKNENYFKLKQSDFLNVDKIEDDETDLKKEIKKADAKMEAVSADLEDEGFIVVSAVEYKKAEKAGKDEKLNNFTTNFTEEEKLVYQKTKEFLEEYGIESASQKSFVVSLRPHIVSGEEIDEHFLEEHAQKSKKDLNKIFESGVQGMICDFVKELQTEINSPKKKPKF